MGNRCPGFPFSFCGMGLDKGLNTVVELDHVYFLFIVCHGTFEVSLNSVVEHALVKGVCATVIVCYGTLDDSFNCVVEQSLCKGCVPGMLWGWRRVSLLLLNKLLYFFHSILWDFPTAETEMLNMLL